jgi:polyisoprenoid-binding protein YceI
MSPTATSLPTGTWNVDPTHSHITFNVRHIGISKVRGEFGSYEGQLVIDEDGTLTASGNVKVDSIDTKDENRDGHLKSADFFDVENYPEITFQSTGFTAIDEDTYEITGDLTLHGVTKPITFKAELGGQETDPFGNARVGLDVSGELSRDDYGMKFNMVLGSGNLAVSDKVKLELDISAVQASE